MKTIQIFQADVLKAADIFSDTGAVYSRFPRNVFVVADETFEALKAGGVRLRRKDPRSVRPPWLRPPTKASATSGKRAAAAT